MRPYSNRYVDIGRMSINFRSKDATRQFLPSLLDARWVRLGCVDAVEERVAAGLVELLPDEISRLPRLLDVVLKLMRYFQI